jgi:AraC family transcriptional regulator
MGYAVHHFLSQSSAVPMARMNLGLGGAVAIWENSVDQVRYENPQGHTFSLYLSGGTGSRRIDEDGIAGFPEAVSILPEGCCSAWEIREPLRFVHLYISDGRLRSGFAETHECDARRLDLPEATFIASPSLAMPLGQLAIAAQGDDMLLAETALAELYAALATKPTTVRGGLSPYLLRRTDEWIEEHLDGAILLGNLARHAGLSLFHFHRMFRLSRGIAPSAWIAAKRVSRARKLLASSQSIAEISIACGFSSQSHLTRVFRQYSGRTPAEYRSLLHNS